MRKVCLVLLVALSTTLSVRILTNNLPLTKAESDYPMVIINELMPNPEGSDSDYEWIELYNTSNSNIDIEGWTVDGKQIPPVVIEAKSYLIVSKDMASLNVRYPINLDIVEVPISLLNGGESIELFDNAGSLVDSVSYFESSEGLSLERRGVLDCSELTLHIDSQTIGKKNNSVDNSCWPTDYSWDLQQDSVQEDIIEILFSTDGQNYYEEISAVGQSEIFIKVIFNSEEISEFEILDKGLTRIANPIITNNHSGDLRFIFTPHDRETLEQVSSGLKVYPELIITEVYPSPETGESEWLEIYNPTGSIADISNWYFTEYIDQNNICVQGKSIGDNLTIQPNDYLVIENDLLKVTLNNGGDEIYLCNEKGAIISEIIYPATEKGLSFGYIFEDSSYTTVLDFMPSSKGLVNIFEENETIEDAPEVLDTNEDEVPKKDEISTPVKEKPPMIVIDYPKEKSESHIYKLPNTELKGVPDSVTLIPTGNKDKVYLEKILIVILVLIVYLLLYISYFTKFDKHLLQMYNQWRKPNPPKYFSKNKFS